jgi:hypothetical protein
MVGANPGVEKENGICGIRKVAESRNIIGTALQFVKTICKAISRTLWRVFSVGFTVHVTIYSCIRRVVVSHSVRVVPAITCIEGLQCFVSMRVFHRLRFWLGLRILVRQICENIIQIVSRTTVKGVLIVNVNYWRTLRRISVKPRRAEQSAVEPMMRRRRSRRE